MVVAVFLSQLNDVFANQSRVQFAKHVVDNGVALCGFQHGMRRSIFHRGEGRGEGVRSLALLESTIREYTYATRAAALSPISLSLALEPPSFLFSKKGELPKKYEYGKFARQFSFFSIEPGNVVLRGGE